MGMILEKPYSSLLTAFERYDMVARLRGWTPLALSDTSRAVLLSDLKAAYLDCRDLYPALAYELSCEIAFRELLQASFEEV